MSAVPVVPAFSFDCSAVGSLQRCLAQRPLHSPPADAYTRVLLFPVCVCVQLAGLFCSGGCSAW
jgi:hypothetical protein